MLFLTQNIRQNNHQAFEIYLKLYKYFLNEKKKKRVSKMYLAFESKIRSRQVTHSLATKKVNINFTPNKSKSKING